MTAQAQEATPQSPHPVEGTAPAKEEDGGKAGFLERVAGSYATRSDKLGMVAAAAVGALVARRSVIAAHPSAGLGEEVAAVVAGGDLASGAWVGSGARARAWFRPEEQDTGQLIAFTAVQVHPMVVAVFAPDGSRRSTFVRGAVMYAATLGATAAVATRKGDERHVWAWSASMALSTLSLTTSRAPKGWGWLGPAYATRIMIGHADSQ